MKSIPAIVSAITLCLCLAPSISHAQSGGKHDDLFEALGYRMAGTATCTKIRRALRDLQELYPEDHFAFAGRKDRTITGIRGCGYAWDETLAAAQTRAMENCRKWEVEYGTHGGTRTCRLMK